MLPLRFLVEETNTCKMFTKSMFESPDDLISESHFQFVGVITLRYLTIMMTIKIFVDKVNVNIFGKHLITHQLDNLHLI